MSNSLTKTKKVLPIKLDPQLYADLKLVSQATETSMAAIIRDFLQRKVQVKAKQLRCARQKQLNIADYFAKKAYTGKVYQAGKSIDQLLYQDQL